jgi:elongation factor P
MKISGNALRPGHVIAHKNQAWVVVKAQHTQPGKGGAYMSVILKNIKEGTKKDERFRASEEVERLFIEEANYEFLYKVDNQCTFMHTQTYEQAIIDQDLFNVSPDFLQPNMIVTVGIHDGVPIAVHLPAHVVLTVEEADPVVKGQTAASSYKPARLNNGIKVMVPPHIAVGEQILVNTSEGTYIERYKK